MSLKAGRHLSWSETLSSSFLANVMKFLAVAFLLCGLSMVFAQHDHGGYDPVLLNNLLTSINQVIASNYNQNDTIDTVNGMRLVDHHNIDHHLLLFINDNPQELFCYVIVISHSWENLLTDPANVDRIANEIYAAINDPNRETYLQNQDLIETYNDFEAARECQGHSTYLVTYTPSFLETSAVGKRTY